DEVDRSEHVVEPALVDQVGGAILGAGHVIDLEAEPQRGGAHELAVGVEVVAGLLLPERMTPQLERLPEPVDVLRATELLDPRPLGGRDVAIDVLARERLALGWPAILILAQVNVVVGEHGVGTLTTAWSTCVSWSLATRPSTHSTC